MNRRRFALALLIFLVTAQLHTSVLAQDNWTSVEVPEITNGLLGLIVEPGKTMVVWGQTCALRYDLQTEEWSYPTYDFKSKPDDFMVALDFETPHVYSDTIFATTINFIANDAGTGYTMSGPWIVRSEDGGKSWQQSDAGLNCFLESKTIGIDPWDLNHMFWGGGGLVSPLSRESSDGGLTWHPFAIVVNAIVQEWATFSDIVFSRTEEGVVVAGTKAHGILRSTDHGQSWTSSWGNLGGEVSIQSVVQDWTQATTWYATTVDGSILVSHDNGISFARKMADYNLVQTISMASDPTRPGRAYITGFSACLRSDDYGETWFAERPVKGVVPYKGITIDPSTGRTFLFVADDMFERVNDQWNLETTPANTPLHDIRPEELENNLFHWSNVHGFVHELNLFSGEFDRWADSWTNGVFTVDQNDPLLRASFGFRDDDELGLYVTRDGGQSWTNWHCGYIAENQIGMTFIHPDTILAASSTELRQYWMGGSQFIRYFRMGTNDVAFLGDAILATSSTDIYFSINRGVDLETVYTYPKEQMYPIMNGNLRPDGIMVSGGLEGFAISTDGGASWQAPTHYPGLSSISTSVICDTVLVVSPADNKIYATVGHRDNWFEYPVPLPTGTIPSRIASNDQWLVVSVYAPIGEPQLYYRPAGTNGVGGGWQALPAEFTLDAPWPNPFNPSTTVPFKIPENSFVTIEVFNSLGQKIAILLDGQMTAGEHEVVWHGDDDRGFKASSGVYFIRMRTGDFSGFRKIVMMR